MLKRFFIWWLGELMALLPAGLRSDTRHRGSVLSITVEPDRIRMSHREDGHAHELGEVAVAGDVGPSAHDRELLRALTAGLRPESTRCEAVVAPELALVKEVELPAAAEENLGQVLGFEMQRLTPFSTEDVYFEHAVIGRGDGILMVRLSVVPRRVVDRAIELLPRFNLEPVPVTTHQPPAAHRPDDPVTLGFRDPSYREPGGGRLRGLLWLVNVVLLGAAIAIPLVHEQRHLEELKAQLAEARGAAETATGIAREVDRLTAEAQFLSDSASARISAVEILEELSTLLPDTTWVFRLELRGGTVHVHGSSAAASALIAILEDSDALSNARFASPVLREGNTGRDRFHITADVTLAQDNG